MTDNPTNPEWRPDPFGRHELRYWDGQQWTAAVSTDGVMAVDPPAPGPPAVSPSAHAAMITPAPNGSRSDVTRKRWMVAIIAIVVLLAVAGLGFALQPDPAVPSGGNTVAPVETPELPSTTSSTTTTPTTTIPDTATTTLVVPTTGSQTSLFCQSAIAFHNANLKGDPRTATPIELKNFFDQAVNGDLYAMYSTAPVELVNSVLTMSDTYGKLGRYLESFTWNPPNDDYVAELQMLVADPDFTDASINVAKFCGYGS